MKLFKHLTRGFLLFIWLKGSLLSGCKQDIPPLPTDELRNVTFKLAGFKVETEPLDGAYAAIPMALGIPGTAVQALLKIEPSPEPQYLYYWSFNNENLEPDVAVDEVGAGIAFDAASAEPNFFGGFKSESYDAGKAMSLRGASIIEISLPMSEVESVTYFEFDISSSDTGPKDFKLSFSVDGGSTYEILGESNQFEKMSSQAKNSYRFNFSEYSHLTSVASLKVKFEFLAGTRPGEPDDIDEYNPIVGTVRLDNIRLSGVYNASSGDPTTPSTLHYYIFSAEDGSVVQQRELAMSALGESGTLDVKLADGNYDVLFVAYRSDKGVLLPEDLSNANEFYFGQHFDDYQAVTYAALQEGIVIDEAHVEEAVTLNRCYSLVEFDFTDGEANLQRVKKVEIVRLHDDFLYAPFGMPAAKAESGADRIPFSDFDHAKNNIALHQFFGLLDGGESINYELIAYGEGDVILNTVILTQELRNNVRLRLRGKLLGESGAVNGFSIALDTEWGELLDREF